MPPGVTPGTGHPLRWHLQQNTHFSHSGLGVQQRFCFLVTLGDRGRKWLPPHPVTSFSLQVTLSVVRVMNLPTRTVFHIHEGKLKSLRRAKKLNHMHKIAVFYRKARQRLQVHLSEKESPCWTEGRLRPEMVIPRASYSSWGRERHGHCQQKLTAVQKGQWLLSL